MGSAVVFFLLFILPLIIAPFGISYFENPKIILSEFGILLLLLIELFTDKVLFRKKRLKTIYFLLIFLITVIDFLYFRSQLSLFGNVFRMQGIFLLWFLLIFFYLTGNYKLQQYPGYIYFILLIAELSALFILPLNESNRYVGTMGEPNATAAFMIFLWPFAFFSDKRIGRFERITGFLIFIPVAIILILTRSRSAMIAFFLQLIFIILFKLKLSTLKSLIICFVLFALSLSLPFFEQNLIESRSEIWRAAFFANQGHLLFGTGFGNLETVLHNSAVRQKLLVKNNYFDSSHNLFLDWWVQAGLAGIIIMISLLYRSIRNFIKEKNIREIVLFLGLIAVLSFNPASIVSLLAFWWLLAQGIND